MLEGYAFDSLWSDDASTLYRGRSSVSPPVLLLVLSEYPRPEALKRLGMGLAISRSIIQAHGGELWAVTDVPSGAAFRFSLPVARLAPG